MKNRKVKFTIVCFLSLMMVCSTLTGVYSNTFSHASALSEDHYSNNELTNVTNSGLLSDLEVDNEITKRIKEENINIIFNSEMVEINETINTKIALDESVVDFYFVENGISVTNSTKETNAIQLNFESQKELGKLDYFAF